MTSARALSCLLVLMTSLCPGRAQWAQTIDWGGAGMGKRASLPAPPFWHLPRHQPTPPDAEHALSSSSTSSRHNSVPYSSHCRMETRVLNRVNDIIAAEEARIQRCLDAQDFGSRGK